MRFVLAGIASILSLMPVAAVAQIKGEVEGIGFANHYRPDCWTPMLIKVLPETDQSGTYMIQVIQEDLDRDLVLTQQLVTVTGNAEGQPPREQRFWMYFKPEPAGLPDATAGLKELQERLKVFICTPQGKQLSRLAITSTIIDIDPPPSSQWSPVRGTKLVLCVTEGNHIPAWRDYENAVGLIEDVLMITVQPHLLPEDSRGYDAVDAIVWLYSDPQELVRAEGKKMRALKDYVSGGGQLVICQPAERARTIPFGDLLPVTVISIEDRNDLDPLRQVIASKVNIDPNQLKPASPLKVARAQPKPGAVAERWIWWENDQIDAGGEWSPYLVRQAYGLGSVTWVAQDLADPALTGSIKFGWPHVWDFVFDWPNATAVIFDRNAQQTIVDAYAPNDSVDLGGALLSGMEHTRRASMLITLAIVFFLVYWVVAGPGVYLFLVGRRRSQLSWFFFGASAIAAAALTVVLVQLVLRGSPVIHHLSIVQIAKDQPAIVRSRFGLYIPRDGLQQVELKNNAPGHLSYLLPFAMHPRHPRPQVDFPARLQYAVPVREVDAPDPIAVDIPYRSTLKKLEAQWVGEIAATVDGSARLTSRYEGMIRGTLTNGTGKTLRNVYIAFTYPNPDGADADQIIYVASWEPGLTLKLEDEYRLAKVAAPETTPGTGQPGRETKLRGTIGIYHDWDRLWFAKVRRSGFGDNSLFDDSREKAASSFPMLSLFDRLPPRRNGQAEDTRRFELLRRGARHLDLSPLLSAGRLVVLAEADGPLPFPVEVEGDIIAGEGTVLYQFVLPLDRGDLDAPPPTTQPEAG